MSFATDMSIYSEDFISLNINPMFSFKKTMSMHTSNYNISKQPLIKQLPLNVIKMTILQSFGILLGRIVGHFEYLLKSFN
jgi:hypothetical protein